MLRRLDEAALRIVGERKGQPGEVSVNDAQGVVSVLRSLGKRQG